MFADGIRRQRDSWMKGVTHWRWHLEEVYVKINGGYCRTNQLLVRSCPTAEKVAF